MSEKCNCRSVADYQARARKHVAACKECSFDEDGSINPCEALADLVRTCLPSQRRDRCLTIWPEGTFEHYDIRKPGDPLVMQCVAPHEDGHKQVQCHRCGNRLRKDQAISYEVGPEKEMWYFHRACDARPILDEEL